MLYIKMRYYLHLHPHLIHNIHSQPKHSVRTVLARVLETLVAFYKRSRGGVRTEPGVIERR